MGACTQAGDDPTQSAAYWFLMMELARERYDFAAALDALERLRRLGVDVRFTRPADRRDGGATRRR